MLITAIYIRTYTYIFSLKVTMLNSYTYVEEEFICGEFFMVSGLGCPGRSSVGVTTNGTSSLWLWSNSANIVRNSDDGVTLRSCMLVHKDNAPLQSPRRPIIIL
jgi:hypothetical protein